MTAMLLAWTKFGVCAALIGVNRRRTKPLELRTVIPFGE
jgi:hypothetical protein